MSSAEEISAILRSWPRRLHSATRDVLADALQSCSALYGCRTAVAAWEDPEEPWLFIGRPSEGGLQTEEKNASEYSPLVDPAVENVSFYQPATGPATTSDGRGFEGAQLIHESFRKLCCIDSAVSIPIPAEAITGRMFLLDSQHHSPELLLVGDVLALLVATTVDYAAHVDAAKKAAVAEERMRVARDLHDGLLQSFTGIVLQLETVHDILNDHPDRAHRMLTEVQAHIMSDQRELRAYVENLGPRRRAEMKFDFRERLDEWRLRFENQWSVRVAFDGARVDPLVAALLGQETLRLIQEAVTNSAKHGSATEVAVTLTTSEGKMRIEVVDNGCGFPFQGRRTLEEIRNGAGGPFVLAERVAALNGDMNVDSGENGAHIEISIPLGWSGT